MLRVGVAGVGEFGRLHAETIMRIGGATLAAVVDPCEQRLASYDGVQTRTAMTDEAASLADAWIVATSTETHVPLTKQLLQLGKFVLCEKPLSDSLEEARSLGKYATERLMLGHILLFNSEFRSTNKFGDRSGQTWAAMTESDVCCQWRCLNLFPKRS